MNPTGMHSCLCILLIMIEQTLIEVYVSHFFQKNYVVFTNRIPFASLLSK